MIAGAMGQGSAGAGAMAMAFKQVRALNTPEVQQNARVKAIERINEDARRQRKDILSQKAKERMSALDVNRL
jgi:hypothetical protein